MANAVQKSTFLEDVYKNFYAVVNAINDTNIHGKIYPSMPDVELNLLSSYPIIILESPQADVKQFNFGKSVTEGTISFNVYTTSAKLRDQIIDKIVYAIETNKGILASKNLRQVFINRIVQNQVARGKIKVNYCEIPVTFKFYSDKTVAY